MMDVSDLGGAREGTGCADPCIYANPRFPSKVALDIEVLTKDTPCLHFDTLSIEHELIADQLERNILVNQISEHPPNPPDTPETHTNPMQRPTQPLDQLDVPTILLTPLKRRHEHAVYFFNDTG